MRPQENKTQPSATASTGGKKVICGRNAQKCQKYSFSNGRFGPKRKAAAGCLNREHAALNIWRESATSNFKKQPKTAVSPFRRRRAPARKFITFFYWFAINFSFVGCNCHIGGGQVGARLLPHLPSGLAQPQALDLGISVL